MTNLHRSHRLPPLLVLALLRVGPGVTVGLRNLTFRGGRTDLAGGGIINYGTLTARLRSPTA
jgi:hypothetical protein